MPRKVAFVNEYIYHICNRGVEKRIIFTDMDDFNRFVQTINYYQHLTPSIPYSHFLKLAKDERQSYLIQLSKAAKLVDILSYCLMPNHFHLLLRQKVDLGISTFLSNISNSYAKYYNTKYSRVGPLYQGPFRAVFIESGEQLVHVFRYIHINPTTSSLVQPNELQTYPWSSLMSYLEPSKNHFVEVQTISSRFPNIKSLLDFHYNQIDYARELENIKHLTLEE